MTKENRSDMFMAKYGRVNTPENHEFMRAMGSREDHPKWAKNRSNYELATAMVRNPTAPVEFARHGLKADFYPLQHASLAHPDLGHDDLMPFVRGDNFPHSAIRHPNMTNWGLESVISLHGDLHNSDDRNMVGMAVQHPNISHQRIQWAVEHKNPQIRAMVGLRPDLDSRTYAKLEADPVKFVGAAARIGQWPRHEWTDEHKNTIRQFLAKNDLNILYI